MRKMTWLDKLSFISHLYITTCGAIAFNDLTSMSGLYNTIIPVLWIFAILNTIVVILLSLYSEDITDILKPEKTEHIYISLYCAIAYTPLGIWLILNNNVWLGGLLIIGKVGYYYYINKAVNEDVRKSHGLD